jgi:D-glycero-alpha-D-manno-heptose-7-phosphate kinase
MGITVKAPNRIDLAGGTTDLYPLFLLMEGGFTVNLAVSILSRVTIESVTRGPCRVASKDLGESLEVPNVQALPLQGPLSLVSRTIKAFGVTENIDVVTHNEAPPGSGLGASSALTIALIQALLASENKQWRPEQKILFAANVETAVIKVPAGLQDYIAAVYGGLSFLEFGYHGFFRQPFPMDEPTRSRLQDMILLSYTGEGRFSGMNNWEVTKRFIDGDKGVIEKLTAIRDMAKSLADSIRSNDWDNIAPIIGREWQLRKSLAPGISTRQIESIINSANSAGASAGKICGAGGGGCMVTIVKPSRRSLVERAILDAGGIVMDFEIDVDGVKVDNF